MGFYARGEGIFEGEGFPYLHYSFPLFFLAHFAHLTRYDFFCLSYSTNYIIILVYILFLFFLLLVEGDLDYSYYV